MVFVMTLHGTIRCGLVTHGVLCAMCGKQVGKSVTCINRSKGCGYMSKPTMLAGQVSDVIEEARGFNEQRQ